MDVFYEKIAKKESRNSQKTKFAIRGLIKKKYTGILRSSCRISSLNLAIDSLGFYLSTAFIIETRSTVREVWICSYEIPSKTV